LGPPKRVFCSEFSPPVGPPALHSSPTCEHPEGTPSSTPPFPALLHCSQVGFAAVSQATLVGPVAVLDPSAARSTGAPEGSSRLDPAPPCTPTQAGPATAPSPALGSVGGPATPTMTPGTLGATPGATPVRESPRRHPWDVTPASPLGPGGPWPRAGLTTGRNTAGSGKEVFVPDPPASPAPVQEGNSNPPVSTPIASALSAGTGPHWLVTPARTPAPPSGAAGQRPTTGTGGKGAAGSGVAPATLLHHTLYLCRFLEADVARKRALVAATDTVGDGGGLRQLAQLWPCDREDVGAASAHGAPSTLPARSPAAPSATSSGGTCSDGGAGCEVTSPDPWGDDDGAEVWEEGGVPVPVWAGVVEVVCKATGSGVA
jgi:hypothetical protein